MENTGVVLLTDGAELLPVQRIADAFFHGSVSADATTITECLSLVTGGKLPCESASLDLVIAVLRKAEHFGNQWFEEFSRVLKPCGKILIQIYVNPIKSKELNSSIERQLLLSGFIELQTLQRESLLPCRDSIPVIIEAKRPSWMTGSSFTLKNARKALPKIHNDDELADLIDEDSLITEEDYMKPQLPASSGDCEAGSIRKACKNCTCGRGEANGKAERLSLTADQLSNHRSACGSCGLGDAFRCGGCPYGGLPPFKHGEKSNFLVTDI